MEILLMPLHSVSTLKYDDVLGPPVRIGVLQHQKSIRLTPGATYRYVTASGKSGEVTASDVICSIKAATPATLQYRLVLRKAFDRTTSENAACPDKQLEPVKTVELGIGFGATASAIEYWQCSRPFPTLAEAEAFRVHLPSPERISVLKEVVQPPSGIVAIEGICEAAGDWVRFEPVNSDVDRITVHEVIVGLDYHWRHVERQRFRGVIEVRIDNEGLLTVISELPVEAYLFSVNSSEMMSVMPDELLKAQTVAARNTMFATMGKHHYAEAFHLCADDHCQCYRGSSRETPDSRRVTLATAGEVMLSGTEICDARYSKMCGGLMESFESVWNDDPRPYLPAGVDSDPGTNAQDFFPANTETAAERLISSKPDCWCNTTIPDVPGYLKYTAQYFRWEFRYTREETEGLLYRTLGNIGELRELVPVKRGKSGRIEYLKIVAANGEWTIGKEFTIRKALSPTFLYSSAFVIEHVRGTDGKLESLIIRGAGWGHGAGLCQVGATMMAYKGRTYREILLHYYPNTTMHTLAPAADEHRLGEITSHREPREGERCYEFYNCYAVATCPVYLEEMKLEAHECGEGVFAFNCSARELEPELAARSISCQFLDFSESGAKPKK